MYIFNNLDFLKNVLKEEYKTDWLNLNEEYLTQFNILKGKTASLPVDFAADDWKIYEKVGFPKCFFFRNSYLKEKTEWLPISLENPYQSLFEYKYLNIRLDDYDKLCEFVETYQTQLIQMANDKYSLLDFIDNIKGGLVIENRCSLNEMANLPPSQTGLNHRIWVDNGQTHKKGGHWLRIKVSSVNGDATLTIPSLDWVGGEVIKPSDRTLIEKYVKINMDKLTKTLMGQMTLDEYKNVSMKVDSKGLPIKNLDVKSWVLFGSLDNNINIYVNNKQPIKYFVTSDNKNSLFKTDDGQNIVFDKIYMQDYSNKFCIGEIGEVQYMLTAKGKMIEI